MVWQRIFYFLFDFRIFWNFYHFDTIQNGSYCMSQNKDFGSRSFAEQKIMQMIWSWFSEWIVCFGLHEFWIHSKYVRAAWYRRSFASNLNPAWDPTRDRSWHSFWCYNSLLGWKIQFPKNKRFQMPKRHLWQISFFCSWKRFDVDVVCWKFRRDSSLSSAEISITPKSAPNVQRNICDYKVSRGRK